MKVKKLIVGMATMTMLFTHIPVVHVNATETEDEMLLGIGLADESYSESTILGDVNQDGLVTYKDIEYILTGNTAQSIRPTITEQGKVNGDLSGNGHMRKRRCRVFDTYD